MYTNTSNWFKRHPLIFFFALAYLISWSFMIPVALTAQGLVRWQVPYSLYYFASFGPLLSALIVTAATEGWAGVRKLLGGLRKWRVELRYYVFAILVPIGLFTLALLVNWLINGTQPNLRQLGEVDYLPYLTPLGVLGVWLLTYGLGEETGWRGFALPHLQRNHSAAMASLILSFLWSGWHLPAFFFRDTYLEMGPVAFPLFMFMQIFTAMIFTWLFNSTGGSLLLVVIFHAVFNWLGVSEVGGPLAPMIMSAPLILWALFVPRRYGLENAAPLQKQVA